MAKDPAFLFYTDNFQSGTQFFTNEQVGKYIRLLCAQHLHGHLTEKQVLFICGTYDDDIMEKFRKDEDGKYYNERLKTEVDKRKTYSESRAVNRLGRGKKQKKKTSKSYVPHMGNENGNENEDINTKKVSIKIPELQEFLDYAKTLCAKAQINYNELSFSIESKYVGWVEAGWRDGHGAPIKIWKTKLSNTLPHLKPIRRSVNQAVVNEGLKREAGTNYKAFTE